MYRYEDKGIPPLDPEKKKTCGHRNAICLRILDEDHGDEKLGCPDCGLIWNVDGPDA